MENKKFKIKFLSEDEVKENLKSDEQKIKSMLKVNSNGIYSKLLVFIYENEVCAVSEVTNILTSYYKIPFDKSNMGKYLQVLSSVGLISYHEAFFAMNNNHNNILNLIREKHTDYLKGIPTAFQKKYSNMRYYYVTEYGKTFINNLLIIIFSITI